MCSVYMHKAPNGKIYIGITQHNPAKRWKANGNGYRNQIVFWRAIQKYGWNNIEHSILETNLSLEQACILEKEYIKKYNSCNPKYGYNRCEGGLGSVGHILTEEQRKRLSDSHKNPSEEIRKKYSEGNKGRYCSKETREKMSKSRMGHEVSQETRKKLSEALKGKNCSEETRKRISESLKQYYKSVCKDKDNSSTRSTRPREKKVICVETEKTFPSIKQAADFYNVSASSISEVLNNYGRRKSVAGYHWRFLENETSVGMVDE